MAKRQTLHHGFSTGGWTEEYNGSMAVGPVLMKAGAKEEDFNVLGDPAAAQKVVALLKQLNSEDVVKSNGNGETVQPSA